MYNHEEIAETLKAFHTSMKEAGFTNDQAFELTKEYFIMSMDSAVPGEGQDGDDTFNPYNDPEDEDPY